MRKELAFTLMILWEPLLQFILAQVFCKNIKVHIIVLIDVNKFGFNLSNIKKMWCLI